MATRKRKRVPLAKPTPPLQEYFLGHFGFPDDMPMARVLDVLQPAVLRIILVKQHGFPADVDPTETVDCEYFFIGSSTERARGRSRIKVTYRLVRPPKTLRKRNSPRDVSRRRSLYGWIGSGTNGGVSLYSPH